MSGGFELPHFGLARAPGAWEALAGSGVFVDLAQCPDYARDPEDAKRPFRTQSGALVYGIHACGMAVLDASWFVNHIGEQPNLELVNYEGSAFNSFRTLRPVRAGEELLHDYARSFP